MYNNNRKYIYKEEEEERIDETGEGRLRGGCVRFPSSTPQGSFYLVDGNTQTKKRKKTKKKKIKQQILRVEKPQGLCAIIIVFLFFYFLRIK